MLLLAQSDLTACVPVRLFSLDLVSWLCVSISLTNRGKNLIPHISQIEFTISFIMCFWIHRQSVVSVVSCKNTTMLWRIKSCPVFWLLRLLLEYNILKNIVGGEKSPVLFYFLPAVIIIITILTREHVKHSVVRIVVEQLWLWWTDPLGALRLPTFPLEHGSCFMAQFKPFSVLGRDYYPRVVLNKDHL